MAAWRVILRLFTSLIAHWGQIAASAWPSPKDDQKPSDLLFGRSARRCFRKNLLLRRPFNFLTPCLDQTLDHRFNEQQDQQLLVCLLSSIDDFDGSDRRQSLWLLRKGRHELQAMQRHGVLSRAYSDAVHSVPCLPVDAAAKAGLSCLPRHDACLEVCALPELR